jgi:hypothetical protein
MEKVTVVLSSGTRVSFEKDILNKKQKEILASFLQNWYSKIEIQNTKKVA